MSPCFSKPEEAAYHKESIWGRGVGKGEKDVASVPDVPSPDTNDVPFFPPLFPR